MSRLTRRREPQEFQCRACGATTNLIDIEIDLKKHAIYDLWRCKGAIPHVFKRVADWRWNHA